jgi:hypothetical protein
VQQHLGQALQVGVRGVVHAASYAAEPGPTKPR